jgi:hypothetical protein
MEHAVRAPQQQAMGITKATEQLKPRGRAKDTKIIHQAVGTVPLCLRDFSFLLPVRGQTPTLLLPLIGVPVRRQATALPHPGIAASKLLSMSQSFFAKRELGLSSIEGGMGMETSSDCSGELKVIGESIFLCSTNKGKVGLVQSS